MDWLPNLMPTWPFSANWQVWLFLGSVILATFSPTLVETISNNRR